MERSVVIIGGGLGGLFTGAILAKEGCRVTVLEKNAVIGGGLQSFTRFGEIFDTGMHVIAGMRPGGNIYRICEYLGITDKLHLEYPGPDIIDSLYFAQDKITYRIAMGREGFVKALSEHFPHERENLEKYVEALYKVVDEIDLYFLRPSAPFPHLHGEDFLMAANEFIAKYIADKKLQSVLAYMNPLYSGRKNRTPAFIHALISVLYINGPARFAGGSVLFAQTLEDCIESCGGRVLAADAVTSVRTEGKWITDVSTAAGHSYKADYYISDIHPCTLFTLFDDPSALPKAWRARLDSIPNSYSAFTLNIKLKPDAFKYIKHTGYYMSAYDDIWEFDNPAAAWPLGFLYMTPPELNQRTYARKMIVSAPMVWEHVKKWEHTYTGRRGKEYEDWKSACAEKLLDKMEEMYPGFRLCVEAVNTASPLTVRDFYGVKEGAMCGYAKDCNNIALSQVPVVTKIKNLLLTGQNCNVHGFCGVPLTAITTSEAILGHNYILSKLNRV